MKLKIATWNVQNFSSENSNFENKKAFLAEQIVENEIDVIGLQEILNDQALSELANDIDYDFEKAPPDKRGISVAFLIKKGINADAKVISGWDLPAGKKVHDFDSDGAIVEIPKLPRPALSVVFKKNEFKIEIVTTHLKSKLLSFKGNFSTTDEVLRANTALFALERRAAEATTLRNYLSGKMATGQNIVLLGDLNDGPEAATTQIFLGPSGSQIEDSGNVSNKNSSFHLPDAGDSRRLFNILKLVPQEKRWSRTFNGQPELLDHILVSDALLPREDKLRILPKVEIFNSKTTPLTGDSPETKSIVPDHALVTAEFDF